MKKVIKTEEFSYHENIAKLKKLLQRRENTNIPMKNLLQELKAPPVHHEGKRCPPTCNQQKKCQYIRKVFIEKIKTPTSLQRLSSCDPPTLENKIFMYNINITCNISLSVFCNSRSCKRREILFQKSWLLFSTWREYFYSQPTHFSGHWVSQIILIWLDTELQTFFFKVLEKVYKICPEYLRKREE